MTSTATTNDPTTTDAGVSPEMARMGDQMLLLAAVQRAILCPSTGLVLDVRTAVYIEVAGAPAFVLHADAWDPARADFLATYPDAVVIDGRAL